MSLQENTRIIERWMTAVNTKDYDSYADLFSKDVVFRSTATSEPVQGKTWPERSSRLFLLPSLTTN